MVAEDSEDDQDLEDHTGTGGRTTSTKPSTADPFPKFSPKWLAVRKITWKGQVAVRGLGVHRACLCAVCVKDIDEGMEGVGCSTPSRVMRHSRFTGASSQASF